MDDVGVVDSLENTDLPRQELGEVLLSSSCLVHNLYGNLWGKKEQIS